MNPAAVKLFKTHGIDLRTDLLEVAVCAQHNNGGLAGNIWYESANRSHFFPIGEVNGSHGVARPGGTALNAGQVGAFRAAEWIAAHGDRPDPPDVAEAHRVAATQIATAQRFLQGIRDWKIDRAALQARMSSFGGLLRDAERIEPAVAEAQKLYEAICREGYPEAAGGQGLDNRHLALAHWVYLSAIAFQITSGVGSRGSGLVRNGGLPVGEDVSFRERVLETHVDGQSIHHRWVTRRPIPVATDGWFETIWAEFQSGAIYK